MTDSLEHQHLIPLMVGVTGHRDLRPEDESNLRAEVRKVFAELRRQLPHTPLSLLSCLAEGADQLVAEVALQEQVTLLAALPANQKIYETTFSSSESVASLRNLISRAAQCWVIPDCQPSDSLLASKMENWQFAMAGAYLIQNCQILIALWDGHENSSEGSTAQVVRFALKGIPHKYGGGASLLGSSRSAQVYLIHTPRLRHTATELPTIHQEILWPQEMDEPDEESRQAAVLKAQERLDEYNRDVRRFEPRLSDAYQKSRQYLLPDDAAISASRAERVLLDSYCRADALAIFFQRRALRALQWTNILALLAMLTLQTYLTLPAQPPVFIVAYVALVLAAFGVYFLSLWRQLEIKYLDYRSLAEGFRVQLFWRFADLTDSAADFYLRRQQGELSWIRNALRNRQLLLTPEDSRSAGDPQPLSYVKTYWIESELGYYEKAATVCQQKENRCKRLAQIFIGLDVVLVGIQTLWWEHLALEIAIVMLPVMAAVLMVYIRTRGFAEHARQYSRMAGLFRRAASLYPRFLTPVEASLRKNLVLELGKEALIENGDWVILHRDRPMEGPNVA